MFDFATATPHEAATYLVQEGFTILPIKLGAKVPPVEWKPYQTRQPTNTELDYWFQQHDWQVGIICGTLSNVVVLDCDTPKAVEWAKANMPPTPLRTLSGSGRGMHFWYRQPKNQVVTNARSAWVLPPRCELELDIRGQGGQVLAPGALHKSGKRYHLDEGSLPLCRATIDQLPYWPVDQLQPPPPPPRATTKPPADRMPAYERAQAYARDWAPAIEGQGGDVATFANACALVRGFALLDGEAMDILAAWNRTNQPPWTEGELWTKVCGARAYGRKPFGYLLDQEPTRIDKAYAQVLKNREKPADYACTDLGNAEFLRDGWGDRLRWCHQTGCWLFWTGSVWEEDERGAWRCASEMARARAKAAFDIVDEKKREAALKWARASESASRHKSCLQLAQTFPEVSIDVDDLDPNPWLLNCQNGTLNLRTGELKPHDPRNLCTRIVRVAYDPAAECPNFLAFMATISDGNQEWIDFLQRALGYSLNGTTMEQKFFMCFGEGSNGKTVLLELVLWLLGTYAIAVDPTTWLEQKDPSKPRPDIARMRGARFTKSSESRDGLRLDMGVVKQVTGGDRLTARHLYQKETSFEARCKPWFATNHKPEIPHTDHGTWRRIILVHFGVKIPEDKADGELAEKLRDEGPGILAWLVRGALDWLRVRLAVPEVVARHAREYKADQDVLGGFFADCCDQTLDMCGQKRWVNSSDIYTTYRRWADKMGERVLSSQKFGRMMAERGFQAAKVQAGRRIWRGIGLLAGAEIEHTSGGAVADIGPFPESTHVSDKTKAHGGFLETPSYPPICHQEDLGPLSDLF